MIAILFVASLPNIRYGGRQSQVYFTGTHCQLAYLKL